jgi:glycosyltransferase involved in cell wall biosynthesis
MHEKVTVLIPTYNCETSIRDTLESVKWADEIVVIDSYSTDRTLEIVKAYTDNIYKRVYDNPSNQKNWALKYCSYKWVLQLDSDEVLESGSAALIMHAIQKADIDNIAVYRLPRKNHMHNYWLKYGGFYPDYQTRLFNKNKAAFKNIVHEKLHTQALTVELNCNILHFGMPLISKQLQNLDRYTDYEAQSAYDKCEKASLINLVLKPIFLFTYRYFYLFGFLDGWRGFFLALYSSFYFFLTQSKLREKKLSDKTN